MKVAEDADISKARRPSCGKCAEPTPVTEELKAGGTVALTGLVLPHKERAA